jgi:dihydroorotate dehydrogenase
MLLRPILFRLDPEDAHHLVLGLAARFPRLLGLAGARPHAALARTLFGRTIPSPIGLAAGLDKDAVALPLWERLGFGFVEIGTVTPRAQPGNPRPRVHRLPRERALINRMGFPSDGMDVVAARLERLKATGRWPTIPVAINLGKNKDTTAEAAHEDYALLARRFAPFADWLVVNVSSPNTPGLRALQASGPLRQILQATRAAAPGRPVVLKLSPDLEDDALREAVGLAIDEGVAGVVATNTTLGRPVAEPAGLPEGGLSGAPLFDRSRAKLEVVLSAAAGRVPVVGVGGVDRPERAAALLRLGCAAVQVYTGMIYEGPGLIRRLNAALAQAGSGGSSTSA